MNLTIKYIIECVQYFFISINVTPLSVSNKINSTIQTITKSTKSIKLINLTNNQTIFETVSNMLNNNQNINLSTNKQIRETEMYTYSSNLNKIDEYQILTFSPHSGKILILSDEKKIDNIEKNTNPDDILELYIFLLDDKFN